MAQSSTVKIVNNLPQRLPIILTNPTTGKQVHAYLPSKGSKVVSSNEVSEQLNSLARIGKVSITNM